uniref:Putative secreted protein n=1 Tax=Anopheles darlingi TaxID=43151 RepID=A0A2M4DET9_ANODA
MVAPPSYVPLCICVATVEAALPSITNARPPPSLLCSCFFYVEPTQTHTHTHTLLYPLRSSHLNQMFCYMSYYRPPTPACLCSSQLALPCLCPLVCSH